MDDTDGYLQSPHKKQSRKFTHEDDERIVELQHILWTIADCQVTFHKEIKSLFSSTKQQYAHSTIPVRTSRKAEKGRT